MAAARSIQIQLGMPPFSSCGTCWFACCSAKFGFLSSAIAFAATAPTAAPATPAATIDPTPGPDLCGVVC